MANSEVDTWNKAQTERAAANMLEAIHALGQGAHEGEGLVAHEIVDTVKLMISRPVVSQPGEPPGFRTGKLYDSYGVHESDEGTEAYSDAEYSVYLEYGTRYMEPRPHLRTAVELTKPAVPGIVTAPALAREKAAVEGMGGRG